ncbi:MAG: DMT family transporter [Desulfotalea sp.]
MDVLALLFAFLSAVLMATIGVFAKITGLPPELLTFFRLGLGAVFMALFLAITGKFSLILKRPTLAVLISGMFLAGLVVLYIKAINYTTMANAVMIMYLAPLVASIIAHFFLKERLTRLGTVLICMAMFGFAMMMEFKIDISGESRNFIGLAFATMALASYTGFILVNRMIKSDVHVYTSTFWQLFFGGCLMAPFIINTITDVGPENYIWVMATGFFPGFLAILFAVVALRGLPAAMFGTIAYTETVAVVVFAWTLFGESLNGMQLTGCVIIIVSSILKTLINDKR